MLTVFDPIHCDVSSLGGPHGGAVTDTIAQEIDMRTGLVRREWHSLDHVPMADSYSSATHASPEWPFDYFHLNSVDQLPDGTTLISGRNTSALYVLRTATGQVLTRIGGRHSDVRLSPGAATAYQHDATLQPDGTITIFDNGADPKVHSQSRGLVVQVDAVHGTDTLRTQLIHPSPLLAGSQGNVQMLANGNLFVGWGSRGFFTEFSPSGVVLFDAYMHGSYQSYRAYRFPWTGAPAAGPSLVAAPAHGGGPITLAVSWNGDNRTAQWRILEGPSPQQLVPLTTIPRSGFETTTTIAAPAPFLAVQALDAGGAVLATSATIRG
jgi:hypothetical protein